MVILKLADMHVDKVDGICNEICFWTNKEILKKEDYCQYFWGVH